MKTKRSLIIICIVAIFCLLIGGGFVLIGRAMGGQGPFVGGNKWGINLGPVSVTAKRYDGPLDNETISLDTMFESLDIDVAMVEVEVEIGSEASLQLIEVPSGTMKTKITNNVLRVYNDLDNDKNYDYGGIKNKVILTLPAKEFEKVSVDLAMGMLKIQALQTRELTIESSMTSININDLTTHKLDVESSMADVVVAGTLSGKTTIESSMGNVNLTIHGNQEDYGYDLSNSMGSVKYAGKSLDGFNGSASGNKNATNTIEIENSMGNIDVKFQ